MMNTIKKGARLAVCAALCGVLALQPLAAAASGGNTTKYYDASELLPDGDVLFSGYVDSLFSTKKDSKLPQLSGRKDISATDQAIVDILYERIKEVAAGRESCTDFSITSKQISEKTGKQFRISDFNINNIITTLISDYPYELYWYDKTFPVSYVYGFSGMTFSFGVSIDYSASGLSETTEADTAKTSAAAKAAAKAKEIVNNVDPNWSDYAVMQYFKDSICELTNYNKTAANDSSTPYGDPWQLIYVFDGDPDTKVVCEGYSKAFKYLCDLYDFNSDVQCHLVTGQMSTASASGGHMWNSVTINGVSYLVDVTNTDEGSIGSDGELFFSGIPEENVFYTEDGQYYGGRIYIDGSPVSYIYDYETKRVYYDYEVEISRESPKLHTVVWETDDGEVLEEDLMVIDGERPVYNGSEPYHEGAEFIGWSPELTENTVITHDDDDTVYFTALFETNDKCTVSYYLFDMLYDEQKVTVGSEAPMKEAWLETARFAGWYTDENFENEYDFATPVTEDITLYGKFVCTVAWQNYDGTELSSKEVTVGDSPEYDGETPTKPATDVYHYDFIGWYPFESEVFEDTVFTAQFEENINTFTVVWRDDDGMVLEIDNGVMYGEEPEYNGETPTKASDGINEYVFSHWTPEAPFVTEDVDFYPSFDAIPLETDTESEIDSETDTESEIDSETNTESEIDSETDTESEIDSDTDTESEIDSDTDTESEIDSDTDTESEIDSETDTESEIDSETDTESEIDSETDTESEIDSETDTESEIDSETDTQSEIDSETDTESEIDTETDTESEMDSESDTETETDTDTEPKRMLGDVNNDGAVDSQDALIMLRNSIGIEDISDADKKYGDVDENGIIDSADAILALRYSVGLPGENKIGQYI